MSTNDLLSLAGRTAVVTGGSRNIGRAIAEKFAGAGMSVVVLSRDQDAAKQVVDSIREGGGRAFCVGCDVSEPLEVKSAVAEAARLMDGIDVVVNSAGILDMVPIESQTIEHWDAVMNTNLRGTFLASQASIPYLEESAAPRIINISSNAGRMGGFENGMAYTASKGGVIALTYGMARQLASKGITVNCVAPGTIESDMLRERDPATRERLLRRFPVGRFGYPDEVAAAACFFASTESGFATGAVLDVNGGLFMG